MVCFHWSGLVSDSCSFCICVLYTGFGASDHADGYRVFSRSTLFDLFPFFLDFGFCYGLPQSHSLSDRFCFTSSVWNPRDHLFYLILGVFIPGFRHFLEVLPEVFRRERLTRCGTLVVSGAVFLETCVLLSCSCPYCFLCFLCHLVWREILKTF